MTSHDPISLSVASRTSRRASVGRFRRLVQLAVPVGAILLSAGAFGGCSSADDGGVTESFEGVASTSEALTTFSLAFNPASLAVVRGASATSTVTLTRIGAQNTTITLGNLSAPAGMTATFSPNVLAPGVSTTIFKITTTAAVGAGDYTFTMNDSGGTLLATIKVKVTQPSAQPVITTAVDSTLVPQIKTVTAVAGDPTPRVVARLADAHGEGLDFVQDEVVVMDTLAAASALAARWGGRVMKTTAGTATISPLHHVRVQSSRASTALLAADLAAISPTLNGGLRVSSASALGTLAVLAKEHRAGVKVGLNFLVRPDGYNDRVTTDGPAITPSGAGVGGVAYSSNAFEWPTYSTTGAQHIGVTEAWRALSMAGKLGNRVKVAVIDGGFSNDPDLSPTTQYFDTSTDGPFAPNDATCTGGTSCAWHGTGVAQVLAATADNKLGVAGVAGPVADLINIRRNNELMSLFGSLMVASNNNAKILSMSFSAQIPAIVAFANEPFEIATRTMASGGMLLFASAGNDNYDVDATDCFIACWERAIVTPCENDGVTCIGGLADGGITRHAHSNYGSSQVNLYAPFVLYTGASPATTPGTVGITAGTSVSTPYAAGVAALVWAANPSLGANGVRSTLINTQLTSPDSLVRGYVNALGAVKSAIGGNIAPIITITNPTSTMTIDASLRTWPLEAVVDDFENGAAGVTVTWKSSIEGNLGTGAKINATFITGGTHTVTATATDKVGASTSRSFTVIVRGATASVSLFQPTAGQTFYRNETIAMLASAQMSTSIGGDVPCSEIAWHLDRVPTWSSVGCNPTGAFDIVGGATLTASARGATSSRAITFIERPVAAPPQGTIVSPAANTGNLMTDRLFTLSGSAIGTGALTYRWAYVPDGRAEIQIGYGATLTFDPNATFGLSRGDSMLGEMRMYVTDASGQTSYVAQRVKIQAPVS